ncbi:MAG: sugar phosphate isomerase/epimerase family protein [Tepidisphaeraceae bacterium]|jgi:sugar phosphate isomerase/epimerase
MKFAICNEIFDGWPLDRICEFCRPFGYEGLEISPFTLGEKPAGLSKTDRLQLRQTVETRGMQVVGLHWLLAKTTGFYVTHPDAAIRTATAGYILALVHLCADLGGKVMVIGSPKQRSLLPGVSTAQALEFAAEVFRPSLDPALSHGVTLAIEPLGPAETDFLNTAAQGIELIDRLNHPAFRLHLDVKAMSNEPKPIPQIIRESAKHIAHVHVNDPNLRGPGMGDVDHRPIIAALRQAGYDGWLSVETFDTSVPPETTAHESVRYLKQVCSL